MCGGRKAFENRLLEFEQYSSVRLWKKERGRVKGAEIKTFLVQTTARENLLLPV